MTKGMNATLTAGVTAIALTAIAPAHADPISDVLRLSILGGSVVGAPTSITTFDTSIAGTVVETPGSLNVIGFLLNNPLTGEPLDVLNLTSLPIAITEPDGSISDIVGVCSPCVDGNGQGIFFISDPFETQPTGPFSATFHETIASQPTIDEFDLSSLLSPSFIQSGGVANFSSDAEVVQDVPGPIVGTGLPGLILACGILLVLARQRQQIA